MKKIFALSALLFSFLWGFADDKPTFPGGEAALKKYISENTRYPDSAKEMGIEGIVVVGFLVETDGNLTNIKVIKFIDPDLENEAVRVVSGMPLWVPAQKDGNPIQAPAKVDVPFILD